MLARIWGFQNTRMGMFSASVISSINFFFLLLLFGIFSSFSFLLKWKFSSLSLWFHFFLMRSETLFLSLFSWSRCIFFPLQLLVTFSCFLWFSVVWWGFAFGIFYVFIWSHWPSGYWVDVFHQLCKFLPSIFSCISSALFFFSSPSQTPIIGMLVIFRSSHSSLMIFLFFPLFHTLVWAFFIIDLSLN